MSAIDAGNAGNQLEFIACRALVPNRWDVDSTRAVSELCIWFWSHRRDRHVETSTWASSHESCQHTGVASFGYLVFIVDVLPMKDPGHVEVDHFSRAADSILIPEPPGQPATLTASRPNPTRQMPKRSASIDGCPL